MRRIALFILSLLGSTSLHGDILHLRDGSRHYGDLISQTDAVVVFRVVGADGGATMTRTFPASEVIRVERSEIRIPPSAEKRGPTSQPSSAPSTLQDSLRAGFAYLDAGKKVKALVEIQLVVNRAKPAELEELDRWTRDVRGVPLAEVLAAVRFDVAVAGYPRRPFTLRVPTRFERVALGKLLERKTTELLEKTYSARTLAAWPANEEEYAEVQADSRAIVADASLAAAMTSARIKFDPRIEKDHPQRKKLIEQRDSLVRFAARVLALKGYTDLPEEQPTSQPAEEETTEPRDESDAPEPDVTDEGGK